SLSRTLLVVARIVEVGKKIERTGNQYGAVRPGELEPAAAGIRGIGDGLDMLEIRLREGREVPRSQRADARGLGRDEGAAEDGQRAQHELGPLVAQDRDDEHVAAVG